MRPAEAIAPPEHRLDYPNGRVGAASRGGCGLGAEWTVVGTGAGGAPGAARLRDAGLDVLMLEEGALHRTETFVTAPATMARRLYRDAGTSLILGRPPILFAEGRCVGGSTGINGGMAGGPPRGGPPPRARGAREPETRAARARRVLRA